jgi:hypothetical protein
MSIIKVKMLLLARLDGLWAGTYRFFTPQKTLLDQYAFASTWQFQKTGTADGSTVKKDSTHDQTGASATWRLKLHTTAKTLGSPDGFQDR